MKPNFLLKLFSKKKVITRIAPSPTGNLHIGTARSALFNYLLAKKHGGTFILRIEDTDTERSTKEFEENILAGLKWLGLSYDALYRQSERGEVYTRYLSTLISSGKAYVSKEASTKETGKQVEVVRLKNKGEKVSFRDEVRGDIEFDTAELGDFVIARSLTEPLYHLAVVVDDHEMGVTHVVRGEDHISNTPRQILIQRALGIQEPLYAHIPLILAPDRSKMSKRKGSTSISEYRENGFLPEALVNYMAFLGWNPGTDKEVYTLSELVKDFSLEQVQKGGAIFDIQKLGWFNKEHLKRLPSEDYKKLLEEQVNQNRLKKLPQYSDERYIKVLEVEGERIHTTQELQKLLDDGELDNYFQLPHIEAKFSWKEDSPETTKKHLLFVHTLLEELSEKDFSPEKVRETLWSYVEEVGKGSVLWPMRVALSGKEKSPDPFILASILGKKETLLRLTKATELL